MTDNVKMTPTRALTSGTIVPDVFEDLNASQRARFAAVSCARQLLTTSQGMFSGTKIPENAVDEMVILADWILGSGGTAEIDYSEPLTPVLQEIYNRGWNDHRAEVILRAGRVDDSTGNDTVAVDWSQEHPSHLKDERGSDEETKPEYVPGPEYRDRFCGERATHGRHLYDYGVGGHPFRAICNGLPN